LEDNAFFISFASTKYNKQTITTMKKKVPQTSQKESKSMSRRQFLAAAGTG